MFVFVQFKMLEAQMYSVHVYSEVSLNSASLNRSRIVDLKKIVQLLTPMATKNILGFDKTSLSNLKTRLTRNCFKQLPYPYIIPAADPISHRYCFILLAIDQKAIVLV